MRVTLLTTGRTKRPFTEAEAHYLKLLRRHLTVEVIAVREDRDLERRLPEGAHLVALDSAGKARDSMGWSRWLERRRLEARDVCLLVGGPGGLPAVLRDRADELVSFGPQTMAHQLARIVVLEQLFRAARIAAGEPYHR
jgi:23S rRNA (pseudouridine1915-N3)-methyltransferase